VTRTTARARLGQLAEQLHQPQLEARLQAGRRLVQEQHARPPEQLGRHGDALALPAGEVRDPRAAVVLERELRQDAPDDRVAVARLRVAGSRSRAA